MDDPYKVLGVARDASTEEIRRAYRQRAKETHPDVRGGDHKEFARVQRAMITLANPEKRKHYDNTGSMDEGTPDNADAQAINLLVGFMQQAVLEFDKTGGNLLQVDLVNAAKQWLDASELELFKQKGQLERAIDKLAKVEKRLRRKTAGMASTLNRAILSHINDLHNNLRNKDQQLAAHKDARLLLNDYEFDVEKVIQPLGGYTFVRL